MDRRLDVDAIGRKPGKRAYILCFLGGLAFLRSAKARAGASPLLLFRVGQTVQARSKPRALTRPTLFVLGQVPQM